MSWIDPNPNPNYTQRSVAWPSLTYDKASAGFDDVLVDLGDGSHESGIAFVFQTYGIRIEAFDDAIRTLLDPRIVRVLTYLDAARLAKAVNGDRENAPAVSPQGLINLLEMEGFVASSYHKRGASR